MRSRTCRSRSERVGGSAITGPEALTARFKSLTGLAGMPVEAAREINDREAAVMFGPVEDVFGVDERAIDRDLRVRIHRPDQRTDAPTLVYFHGGGWVVGSLDSHDGVARFLCTFGRCVVISVAYRLAPEHRFPAAVEDAWAATRWASQRASEIGGDPNLLAVAGDSSGGNLAAVVARRARDQGLTLELQLLVYPALDIAITAGLAGQVGYWVKQYLLTDADAADPDASPLRAADLTGVAPAAILSCGLDPLKDQAVAYAGHLREAGVTVEHIVYPGLIHGAYRMPAVLDGARQMLVDSAAALTRAFEQA